MSDEEEPKFGHGRGDRPLWIERDRDAEAIRVVLRRARCDEFGNRHGGFVVEGRHERGVPSLRRDWTPGGRPSSWPATGAALTAAGYEVARRTRTTTRCCRCGDKRHVRPLQPGAGDTGRKHLRRSAGGGVWDGVVDQAAPLVWLGSARVGPRPALVHAACRVRSRQAPGYGAWQPVHRATYSRESGPWLSLARTR